MGVRPEAAHGLGLPADALAGGVVQTLRLDQREGHVAVQANVVGEVDPLLAAFAQEFLDLVAAVGEGGGDVVNRGGRGDRRGI